MIFPSAACSCSQSDHRPDRRADMALRHPNSIVLNFVPPSLLPTSLDIYLSKSSGRMWIFTVSKDIFLRLVVILVGVDQCPPVIFHKQGSGDTCSSASICCHSVGLRWILYYGYNLTLVPKAKHAMGVGANYALQDMSTPKQTSTRRRLGIMVAFVE